MVKKIISIMTAICVVFEGWGGVFVAAQPIGKSLPQSIVVQGVVDSVFLKGIKIDPKRPMSMEFIVSDVFRDDQRFEKDSQRLIKYFLAALATPEDEMWVNLSPYEADRIVPDEFGKTTMGRDLLAQDYLLKQLSASLLHPDNEYGQQFWEKVYAEAFEKYGTTDIPVETFHKVWIVPDVAEVFEHDGAVYVTDARMKVLMEEDYLAKQKNKVSSKQYVVSSENQQPGEVSLHATYDLLPTKIMRSIIIPAIENEINTAAQFVPLRQIYHSLILAKWYKEKITQSLLSQVYVDQNKSSGESVEGKEIEAIYQQYVRSFREGAYNFIRDEMINDQRPMTNGNPLVTSQLSVVGSGNNVPRRYFSGGANMYVDLTYADKSFLAREQDPLRALPVDFSFIEAGDKAAVSDEGFKMKRRNFLSVAATAMLGLLMHVADPREEPIPEMSMAERVEILLDIADSYRGTDEEFLELFVFEEEMVDLGAEAIPHLIQHLDDSPERKNFILDVLGGYEDPEVAEVAWSALAKIVDDDKNKDSRVQIINVMKSLIYKVNKDFIRSDVWVYIKAMMTSGDESRLKEGVMLSRSLFSGVVEFYEIFEEWGDLLNLTTDLTIRDVMLGVAGTAAMDSRVEFKDKDFYAAMYRRRTDELLYRTYDLSDIKTVYDHPAFSDLPEDWSLENRLSFAITVDRAFKRYGRTVTPAMLAQVIPVMRDIYIDNFSRVIFDENTRLLVLIDKADFFPSDSIEAFAQKVGITKVDVYEGSKDKEGFRKELVNADENTVVWIRAHGSPLSMELDLRPSSRISFEGLMKDPYSYSYQEMQADLLARQTTKGETDKLAFIFDSCGTCGFVINIMNGINGELFPKERVDLNVRRVFPFMLTFSDLGVDALGLRSSALNGAPVSNDDPLANELSNQITEPGPVVVKDIFDVEANMWKTGNNPTMFFQINPGDFRRLLDALGVEDPYEAIPQSIHTISRNHSLFPSEIRLLAPWIPLIDSAMVVASEELSSSAEYVQDGLTGDRKGGVDFNLQSVDLGVQGDAAAVAFELPVDAVGIDASQITGITFTIRGGAPIPSLPLYLGFADDEIIYAKES